MIRLITGDCRDVLPTLDTCSVQCCVTSPPYFALRDYGVDGQIGLEQSPDAYVAEMVAVFREVRRVLRDDGTLWLNLGDCYNSIGHKKSGSGYGSTGLAGGKAQEHTPLRRENTMPGLKHKDLMFIPIRVAMALQADGWWVRSDIIWHKPNPMPESVQGSHFSRHLVTIADYERLSGLPYVDERAGDDWAGDMPSLSEIESPRSKAPLSAKSEGHSYSQGSRGTSRREGKASPVFGVGTGQEEQGNLRSHAEGQGYARQDDPEIQNNRAGKTDGCGTSSGDEGQSAEDRAKASRQRSVCCDRKDGREEAPRLCEAEGGDCAGHALHSGNVARVGSPPQEPMSLLQEETCADIGSRNSGQQRRQARCDEHSSCVPDMQFKEKQSDRPSLLVGCPGCDKCVQHHGYTFHLSAGRPTSAHEHVFLLTKRASYFYDADAIKEPLRPSSYSRLSQDVEAQTGSERANGGAKTNGTMKAVRFGGNKGGGEHGSAGRRASGNEWEGKDTANARNVWTIPTQGYQGAHFATMAPALAERCIKAGTRQGDTVLDPFSGAGTTALVADRLGRSAIGIELNPAYRELSTQRVTGDAPLFAEVAA